MGLRAIAVSGGEVDLMWQATSGVSYSLYRDGQLLRPGVQSPYKDYDVKPSTSYGYSVGPVTSNGVVLMSGSPVSVKTPGPPPLSQARLQGVWRVGFKITSTTFGIPKVGAAVFSNWDLTPKCGTGACDLSTNTSDPVLNGTLHRTGSRYQGTLRGTVPGCGAGDVQVTQSIDLRIAKAEFVEGVWKVTAIQGSGGDASPASGGCASGSDRWTIVSASG